MKAHRAAHSIATLCRVLEVSPSGYYAWHRRTPSPRGQEDASLTAEIEAIHTHSRGTYGVPRIHAELVARGRRVGRKRVTRLMRAARLRGVSRRKFVVTTTRAAEARPAPDLVRRAFTATGEPISSGSPTSPTSPRGAAFSTWRWCSTSGVVASSAGRWRRICARPSSWPRWTWPSRSVWQPPSPVIHHSDQGCQYTALAVGARCRQAGVRPSMGPSATATIMRSARASSPRSSASSSTVSRSRRRPRPRSRVRLHRRVVQHATAPFRTRLRVAAELRATAAASRWQRGPYGSCRACGRQDRVHKSLGKRAPHVSHSSHRGSSRYTHHEVTESANPSTRSGQAQADQVLQEGLAAAGEKAFQLVYREKPLRVRSGFEQAHLSLALSRRLMRNLCAIVRVSVRAMGDGRHDRSVRSLVAAQLVGDQSPRLTLLALQ